MRKNLRGSLAREDTYKVARALSRGLSRARRRAQRDCPSTPVPTSTEPFIKGTPNRTPPNYYAESSRRVDLLMRFVEPAVEPAGRPRRRSIIAGSWMKR